MKEVSQRDYGLISRWAVVPGQSYRVQSAVVLGVGGWSDTGEAIDATNRVLWLTNAETQRFFRLRTLP
jgi:hypothetical protein